LDGIAETRGSELLSRPTTNDRQMKSKPRFLGVVSCLWATGLLLPPISRCWSDNDQQRSPHEDSISQEESFKKALSLLKEDRPEAALVELTAAERENPNDPRIHNFRGIVLARLGQDTEAGAEYQAAIRLDPLMEDAYRNLGYLQWTEHNLERAREALVRAVGLSPKDSFAHYYLGRVQLDGQFYADAFRELGLSDVPWPREPDFLIQAAEGYVALGRQEEARKTLHQLAALLLPDARSVRVASLLLAVGENDDAIALLRKLRTRQGPAQAPWAQFDLALAHLSAGRYQEAADQVQEFISAHDSTPWESGQIVPWWSLAGIAYARLGEGDRAVDALHRAAALAPDGEEHWLNLTRELMELSRFAEAISAVQDGLRASPKSYALHLRLGAADLSSGHYEEAETVFRNLVEAGDPLPTSYIGLAQVLLRVGRPEEAASELSAAEQKLGAMFLLSYFRGLSLDRSGKRAEAISAFQEAIRLNPSSAEAHLEMGKTELTVGRVNDAIVELEKALHLSPGNVQAQRLLSQAYRRAGDAKRAAKYAETSAETPPATGGDLLGDFVLPEWQMPEESRRD
jgi:tetratricopeptide (TPR) repeat protein